MDNDQTLYARAVPVRGNRERHHASKYCSYCVLHLLLILIETNYSETFLGQIYPLNSQSDQRTHMRNQQLAAFFAESHEFGIVLFGRIINRCNRPLANCKMHLSCFCVCVTFNTTTKRNTSLRVHLRVQTHAFACASSSSTS